MARFRYGPDNIERFPAVVGGVIHATGVHNDPTPPRLAAAFRDEALATRTRIGDTPLSELPTLSAWRRAFRGFGLDPTQYRSAAEAITITDPIPPWEGARLCRSLSTTCP